MVTLPLLDHLRALRAQAQIRLLAQIAFCDACATVCSPECREDAERVQQARLRLRSGVIWR